MPIADVAASFQEAVADVLTAKAIKACRDQGRDTLLIGGGVAANSRLRALAAERAEKAGIRLRIPRPGLCTDNGAMVAALGASIVAAGRPPSTLALPADSIPPGHRGPGQVARPRRLGLLPAGELAMTIARAAPMAATGTTRFRIGMTTNLNAFSNSPA